jgi:hypothetical protein
MNVPSIYRKVTAGFTIPPRTWSQLLWSATRGAFALFSQPNRVEFIQMLENGTMQESVLSQATFGPAMMLSLFYDLNCPLFKQTNFNASEFLEGVRPALENFHNVGGALENHLQTILKEAAAKTNNETDDENVKKSREGSANDDTVEAGISSLSDTVSRGKEKETLMLTMQMFGIKDGGKRAAAILDHEWAAEAEKDPDSLPAQLSRMVTKELFQMSELNAKTAFLLQDNIQSITFQEGSCKVNNVALLSARAVAFRKVDFSSESVETTTRPHSFEAIDYDIGEGDADSKASIAAQLEVLYDVTQRFKINKSAMMSLKSSNQDDDRKDKETISSNDDNSDFELRQTTIVSVATLEGWLKGGPDNQLRWKLALHRPAFEFPGIEHSY